MCGIWAHVNVTFSPADQPLQLSDYLSHHPGRYDQLLELLRKAVRETCRYSSRNWIWLPPPECQGHSTTNNTSEPHPRAKVTRELRHRHHNAGERGRCTYSMHQHNVFTLTCPGKAIIQNNPFYCSISTPPVSNYHHDQTIIILTNV